MFLPLPHSVCIHPLINTWVFENVPSSLYDERMKQQEGDSKKRIALPIQLFAKGSADVQIPDVIQVMPVGKWDHPAYGEMEITTADIAEFVKNLSDRVCRDRPTFAGMTIGCATVNCSSIYLSNFSRISSTWTRPPNTSKLRRRHRPAKVANLAKPGSAPRCPACHQDASAPHFANQAFDKLFTANRIPGS